MNAMTQLAVIEPALTRTEVAGLVALAARTVPPLWPLGSAIAVNPLAGFEHLAFPEAVRRGAALFGARESLPLGAWRQVMAAGRIDERALRDAAIARLGGIYRACAPAAPGITALDLTMARLLEIPVAAREPETAALTPAPAFLAKWCTAFFDQGVAAAPMPYRELGLYRAVVVMAGHDPQFRRIAGNAADQLLHTVPRDPLQAIAEGLEALAISGNAVLDYLGTLVARLPGWAGHIRWRTENADPEAAAGAPATMADLVALWLLLERASPSGATVAMTPAPDAGARLAAHFGLNDPDPVAHGTVFGEVAKITEEDLGAVFMAAAESTYCNALVPRLQVAAQAQRTPRSVEAQLVFCIDVRSEPFRRALEAEGPYETFGYAGFFGLPIALHPAGGAQRKRLLPVLLAPQHDIAEAPAPGMQRAAARIDAADRRETRAAALFAAAKQGTATAFATAEATGPFAAAIMAARTLAPRLAARAASALRPDRSEALAPDLAAIPDGHGHPPFTLEDKIGYAGALFRLTGLSPDTARLVVLVGHGGSAVNNTYAAALDCGACGGHAGGTNARVLVAMLNEPDVRAGLARRGLVIPGHTLFVAAEHNTTTDQVTIFDGTGIAQSHRDDLADLRAAFARAGAANRIVRAEKLGRTPGDLFTGAVHWGEVRPEWGLAGNAGFIVGPRWLTRAIDLEGRAFLHSYDWRGDDDGVALTTILTAPMVVAQWINCQYLFSAIDNDRYGSGDKTTQNVVGGFGVVQGNGGDLKIGLPAQSLFSDDGAAYHVPQRLLTVVHAPFERVTQVVEANDILARLFGNHWVQLVAIDPCTGRALRWRPGGKFEGEGSVPLSISL